jgi:hypothetical protein
VSFSTTTCPCIDAPAFIVVDGISSLIDRAARGWVEFGVTLLGDAMLVGGDDTMLPAPLVHAAPSNTKTATTYLRASTTAQLSHRSFGGHYPALA